MENSVRNSIRRCLERHTLFDTTPEDGKSVQCAQLEPRTLFSTVPLDIDALNDEALANDGADIAVTSDADEQVQIADSVRELVFIDASVSDAEYLFDELNAGGTTAILIDSSEDGIQQITEHLAGLSDISSIHVISHGSAGEIQLGNSILDAEGLQGAAGQVAEWRNALSEDADILFYGCDLASNSDGLEFMEAVSELTGADVAASDDVTGHQSLDGDYDLEVATGAIHTGIVFDDNLQSLWQSTLAADIFEGDEQTIHQNTTDNPDHTVGETQTTVRGDRGSDSSVALSRDTGDYVVVYTSDSSGTDGQDVFFQLFNADGDGVTVETRVNSDASGDQHSASVAMDDAGNFFITWVSEDADGTESNVYAKFFNADGSERTPNSILVNGNNSATDNSLVGNQLNPDIDVNRDGTHVSITWDGAGTVAGVTDTQGVFGRTFDPTTGNALHDTVRLNEIANDADQRHAVVAVDDSGTSYVAWNDIGDANGQGTIVARKFDSTGNLVSGELLAYESATIPVNLGPAQVSVTTTLVSENASIDVNRDGSVVLLSFEATIDVFGIESGIIAQAFDGTDFADLLDYSASEEFSTQEDAEGQFNSSIAFDDDETSAILSWEGRGDIGGQFDEHGIWVREFEIGQNANDGNRPILLAAGDDILVNQTTNGIQEAASVAVNHVDNFVVAWSGAGSTDGAGIFAKTFGTATPTAIDDVYTTDEDTSITLTPLINDLFTGSVSVTTVGVPIGQGKIISNGNGILTFDPGPDFQDMLPTDAPAVVTIPYTISDGTNSHSANIAITVTGKNDNPTDATTSISLFEDTPAFISALPVQDIDVNDTFTYSNLHIFGTDPGGLSVDLATGGYQVDISHYEYLAEGATVNFGFEFDAADAAGATSHQTVQIVVTGVNDAPVDHIFGLTRSENSPAESIPLPVNDPDVADSHTFDSLVVTGDTSGITFDLNGGFFFLDPSAYEGLAVGETELITFSYNATDPTGNTATSVVNLAIEGENSAPVATDGGDSITESSAPRTYAPSFFDMDADDSAEITSFSVVGNAAGVTTSGDTFTVDPTAYNYLNAGEVETILVNYTVTDDSNATDMGSFTITVIGENSSIISGAVYEDVVGDGSIAGDPLTSNVVVHLFREADGDNRPGAGDEYVSTAFSANGEYSFNVANDEVYWVYVDSNSIAQPQQGFNGTGTFIWAEQTYAAAGAYFESSPSLFGETLVDGAFFGGKTAGVADAPLLLTTSEHIIKADLFTVPDADGDGIADIYDVDLTLGIDANNDGADDNVTYVDTERTDVEFGFSFNVVTETHDNGGQGTLRQFIDNSNELAGANVMRFVPVGTQNSDDGTYWQIGITSLLPVITDDATTIDGTAYSKIDGITEIDSNAGFISSRHSRLTHVGTDELLLSEVEAPELEIVNGTPIDVTGERTRLDHGFATHGDSTTIQFVSIHGFGSGEDTANIRVGNRNDSSLGADNFLLYQSVIGAGADVFNAPDSGDANFHDNISAFNSTGGQIVSNLIGFADFSGLRIQGSSGWTLEGNEIRESSLSSDVNDAVAIVRDSGQATITSNLIVGSGGVGIDTFDGGDGNQINNNTIIGSGRIASGDTAGVRLYSSDNRVIKNVIADNAGDGVLVLGDLGEGAGAFQGNLISRNEFSGNGDISIDLADGGDVRNGDGVTLNDGNNTDAIRGNLGLDTPELAHATVSADGLTLTVEGTALPGSIVEIYKAQASGTPGADSYGEGENYLDFVTTDAAGNFTAVISLDSPAAADMMITAIAIDFSTFNTSEFAHNVEVCEVPTGTDDSVSTPEDTLVQSAGWNFPGWQFRRTVLIDNSSSTLTVDGEATLIELNSSNFDYSSTNAGGTDLRFASADGSTELAYEIEVWNPGGTSRVWVETPTIAAGSGDSVVMYYGNAAAEAVPTTVDISVQSSANSVVLAEQVASGITSNDSASHGFATAQILDDSLVTANGTFNFRPDGSFDFLPTGDFNGTVSFTYELVNDCGVASAPITVSIEVTPVNDLPVAMDDSVSTDEETPLVINTADLLLNDSDVEGPVSIAIDTQPGSGTVVDQGDGTWLYTPNGDFVGDDSFTYTITDTDNATATATVQIAVTNVNDLPVAVDDMATTNEDTDIIISAADLLSNDSDIDGDTLTLTIASMPANGTLTDNLDGTFTYSPNLDFDGPDSFTYTVSDGNSGVATGTVVITVTPVNDLPVAMDDSVSTDEETPLVINTADLLRNDSDVEGPVTIAIDTQPGSGTVVDQGDGTWLYTPNGDFTGPDSFTYTITDSDGETATATVQIAVGNVNDLPVAVDDMATTNEDTDIIISAADLLSNDTDIDGDTLTLTIASMPANGTLTDNLDGTFTYSPNLDFDGPDSFTYTISDGNGGTSSATVEITVSSVNDLPIANDDAITANEDTPKLINAVDLLSNDSDVEGITSISITSQPGFGTVVDQGDGTWLFTPASDFAGPDSFTYTITDAAGEQATASVNITVNNLNDLPTAADDEFSGFEDTPLQIQTAVVLSNDQDPDFDILTAAIISQPSNGTVFDDGTGVWTYTPKANFSGEDSFSYQLRDGNGGSSVGTVTIKVAPVNDIPTAVSNEFQTSEDRPLTILKQTLLANDFDLDGDDLVISQIGQPQNGTLIDNGDSIEYVPGTDFNGSDNLVYQIDDGNGGTAMASVRILVTPVNDAPEAVDDSYTVSEGATLNVATGVLTNDSDRDGDRITARVATQPENGQLTLNLNGSFVYVHDGSETTTDQFEYEVVDENGIASLARVTIDILPTNDAPVTNDDFFAIREDTILEVRDTNSLLNNDIDEDGDPITTSLTGSPEHGTVELNSNGTFIYTPDENFDGTDSFEYTTTDVNGNSSTATVSIQVAPVNDSPVAIDESFTIENNTVDGNVLTNDSDADGDELMVRIQRQPDNGTVTLNPDGSFQYVPLNENSNRSDSFTYVVLDGSGSVPESTAVGEVTINAADAEIAGNGQIVNNDLGNNSTTDGGPGQEAPLTPTDTNGPNLTGTNIESNTTVDDDDDDESNVKGTDPRTNIRSLGESNAVEIGEDTPEQRSDSSSVTAATPYNRVVQSAEFVRISAQELANVQSETQVAASTNRLLEALSSNAFIEGLDSIVAPLTTSAIAPELMLESVVMATSTLSVGYFLWIVRTGYLVASCISASPAWQSYDPLPIMASVQNSEDDLPETDQDRELEAMMGVNPK